MVVFLSDDHGYGDVGCFGSDRVKTPVLDGLAAEGARFTSFYSPASTCSPTRTGMLTGRSPFRLGIYTYIPNKSQMHLRREERTIASLLRDVGYDTCFVGKWAANGSLQDKSQPQPNDHGFDHWFATQNNAVPSHLNPTGFVRNGVPVTETKGYSSAIIVGEALQWLANRQDRTRPFCLFVWFHEPHRVIATPPGFVEPYSHLGSNHKGARDQHQLIAPGTDEYMGNIAHLDHQVGRVLSALKQSGDEANTFVLFTSDNGPIEPGSAGPLRGGKGSLYEGGIRMPGIMRWPGHVTPGQVFDVPVSGLDLLPTFCAAADIAPPTDHALDGQNIMPLLEGKTFERTTPLTWWRIGGEAAIREGGWKLIAQTSPAKSFHSRIAWIHHASLQAESCALYHLREDIAEAHDVATDHPEIVAELFPKLLALHVAMQQEQQRTISWTDRDLVEKAGTQSKESESTPKSKKARPTAQAKNTDLAKSQPAFQSGATTTSALDRASDSEKLAPQTKSTDAPVSTKRPNVLFIAVDDLRPQLGCYGVDWMKTPNIDSLAVRGLRFDRHYVQFAVCIPSRVALLTSLRSERTHQIYGPHIWQNVPDVSTLGKVFGNAGYATVSLGKIWHGKPADGDGDKFDEQWHPLSPEYALTTEADTDTKSAAQQRSEQKRVKQQHKEEGGGSFYEMLDVPDETYRDGEMALVAIDRLKKLAANREKPFLLAVGFHKPHLPFVAPKRYWDLYDRASLPLPPQPDYPKKAPTIARNHGLNPWSNIESGSQAEYDEATIRHLIHGYCAGVSYTDAQIGKLLGTLRDLGIEQNTIIVLWGDHGWHLGDLHQWAKSTNFERATLSPLIVCAPGKQSGVGTSAIVETVDIFPTLVDLCGLPALPLTDGKSFAPLLDDPHQPWKEAAYHVFNRAGEGGKKKSPIIGFAVRTEKARYVEWHQGWSLDAPMVAREFYRYYPNKPDEISNAIDKPELQELISQHSALLRENTAFRPQ